MINVHPDGVSVVFGSTRDYPVWAGAGEGGPRQAMYLTAEHVRQLDQITNHFLSEMIVRHREAQSQRVAA
jgi:hypothetical protein